MLIKKTDDKFIVVSQIIFNILKSQDFERGLQTEECKSWGIKYDIKYETLMPYVSFIKFYNNINSRSFKIAKNYKQILQLIKDMNNAQLINLIELIEKSQKDFCLLSFLSDGKGGER